MTEAIKKPTVFISYSRKDEVWKDRLMSHLGVLSEQGLLSFWDDRQIGVGEDWYEKIQEAMNAASVAILLISAHSLTSKFILREEVSRLLQRRDKEGLRIFPVIAKSCPWQKVDWLSRMQVRPRDGKPLASYGGNRRDEVLSNIATEVYEQFNLASASSIHSGPEPIDSNRINITRLPITGRDLFGRERELEQLDEAWANQKTHILSLVAWGGVGKSALVNQWLARMAEDDYRGASKVYAWSFYSQGTTDKAVSADQFIEAALTWFGDPDPNKGSPWDKGERLARLIGAQRTLLVLDGLEPLQYPPGTDEGRLKDQALQSLLRQLAADNKGLCVISTRISVTDLSPFEGRTTTHIALEHLSPEAGAEVLRAQDVKGTQAELEQASKEFDGHSLALTLLGSYLSDVYGGDVSRRGEVSGLEGDVRYGGHAQRVMTSYEKWFGEGPELAILRILGLFNRPADKDAITALRAAPVIKGLTDTLRPLSENKWKQILAKLRRAKLLSEQASNHPDALDTHPLIRGHFGEQLKREWPNVWRAANHRLYKHFERTAKVFPNTIETMMPLYTAMAHGCEAGKHQEVFNRIYYQRVLRGNEDFSIAKLGAVGADLAAITSFFVFPWYQAVNEINETDKLFILHQAGTLLLVSGRPGEAVQPLQAALDGAISREDWANASRALLGLTQLSGTTGDLDKALTQSQYGVELADRSGIKPAQADARASLAYILHQIGRITEAETIFLEVEEIQKGVQPQYPFLYAARGFYFCDLLLSQGKYHEVQRRAKQMLELMAQYKTLLSMALDNISLGRAYLLQTREESGMDFNKASFYLNQGVDGLRQAGSVDFLPPALLIRAELWRLNFDFDRAQADVDEVLGIAMRSSMSLYQADCHLEYARLYITQEDEERAQESWAKAKEMVERMGYHRRDKDVAEIERQLKEMPDK